MRNGSAPPGPERDEDPAGESREPVPTPDPMSAEDWQAWCDSVSDQDEPPDPDEQEPDPDGLPGMWEFDLEAVVADCRRITAEQAAACARAARLGLDGGQPVGLGRRGPGQPGSARRAAGEYVSRAAGLAAGMLLDTMPGYNALAGFAAGAAGEDDRYDGAADDEVAGAIAAWDRIEVQAAARKHAAVAEFIRQRKNCIVIGVTSASLASFGRRPYGRRGCCRARLPRHRPQPGRPSLHCAITGLPGCQRQGSRRERAVFRSGSSSVSTAKVVIDSGRALPAGRRDGYYAFSP